MRSRIEYEDQQGFDGIAGSLRDPRASSRKSQFRWNCAGASDPRASSRKASQPISLEETEESVLARNLQQLRYWYAEQRDESIGAEVDDIKNLVKHLDQDAR
uniref:t-SNARE coiled-coil homology domain-containing protein n=1 Tax=Macrostomum lignano TaxID=282301 RepID=A0A1I8FGC1_9PLAT